jgi:hypothetical protein
MNHWSAYGTRFVAVLGLVIGIALLAVPGEAQAPKHHLSHLHAALHELKHAHHELKESHHDFGGHKEKAMHAVHHAIHEIENLLHHHKQK